MSAARNILINAACNAAALCVFAFVGVIVPAAAHDFDAAAWDQTIATTGHVPNVPRWSAGYAERFPDCEARPSRFPRSYIVVGLDGAASRVSPARLGDVVAPGRGWLVGYCTAEVSGPGAHVEEVLR